MWLEISGMILFVIMLISVGTFASNLFSSKNQTDESLKKLRDNIIEVAINHSSGGGKTVIMPLDKNTAVVGFNPGADFSYYSPDIAKDPNKFYVPTSTHKGVFMKRPPISNEKCKDTETCLCACTIDFEDGTLKGNIEWDDKIIVCKNAKCLPLTYDSDRGDIQIHLPERIWMKDVFSDKDRGTVSMGRYEVSTNRDTHYWENSFIVLRSDLIDPTGTALGWPIIVGGYRDFSPGKYSEVFINKVSNKLDGSKIISICMKENCLPVDKKPYVDLVNNCLGFTSKNPCENAVGRNCQWNPALQKCEPLK